MAHDVDMRANVPTNALREALTDVERHLVAPTPEEVERLLLQLDHIEKLFISLSDIGVDLRPEQSRWESIRARLNSKPQLITSAARRAGGLAKLRARHEGTNAFWWHLDAEVSQRRRKGLRRTATLIGVPLLVIVGVFWLLQTLFPPSAETLALMDANARIEPLIIAGDWAGAMSVIEENRALVPNEPELIIWESVLAERMGDEERADEALARAQTIMADQPVNFWNMVAQQRTSVSNFEGAKMAVQRALDIEPENPQSYFILGSIAELEQDYALAIDFFQRTYTLAEESNTELAVIARVRGGQLLQVVNPFEAAQGASETITDGVPADALTPAVP